MGMIGIAVGRYGLRLWENDAAGSTKVFRWLPDLRDTIKKSKIAAKVQKCKSAINYIIFVLLNPSLLSAYAGHYVSKMYKQTRKGAGLPVRADYSSIRFR